MALPNANVKSMQQALIAYANATGFSAANPGLADGFVGAKTVAAVAAMLPLLPGIPSELKTITQLAPLIMASPDALKQAGTFITKHASTIRNGIIGLAVVQVATGNTPIKPGLNIVPLQFNMQYSTGGTPAPQVPLQPWYKQTWGIAAIAGTVIAAVAGAGLALANR